MLRSLLNYVPARSFGKHNKKFLYKDGVKKENLIYYPRENSETDVASTNSAPAKLFRVERIKPMKGCPYWEKRILEDLGIALGMKNVAIVKNIPEINAMLWKVKHLVKIAPITFTAASLSADSVTHSYLHKSGEFSVDKSLEIDEARIKATEEFKSRSERMDGETLRRSSRMKWLNPW